MGEPSQLARPDPAVEALPEKCPYCPGTVVVTHTGVSTVPASEANFAALVSHPAGVAQTECKWRIARDRSRQKRGPPTHLL